jgi:uncharacterized membrane protein
MAFPWHLYLLAGLFIVAGLNHFRNPRLYLKITPSYIPFPNIVNYIVGFLEIFFGILLLFSDYTKLAAWLIIILLIAIFPANLNMYQNEEVSLGLPKWVRFLRLPLQFALIIWTYQYTNIN